MPLGEAKLYSGVICSDLLPRLGKACLGFGCLVGFLG